MIERIELTVAWGLIVLPGLLGLWRVGRRPPDQATTERGERPSATPMHRRFTGPTQRAEWPSALHELAATTRAGIALDVAIAETVELRADSVPEPLHTIDRLHRHGDPLNGAIDATWTRLHQPPRSARGRRPDSDDRLALAALHAVTAVGGPPSEPLDRAASMLAERAALRAERRAQSAQAMLSAQVLIALPVVLVGASVVGRGDTASVLFGTTAGRLCLLAGAALDSIGWWWMRRIVRTT